MSIHILFTSSTHLRSLSMYLLCRVGWLLFCFISGWLKPLGVQSHQGALMGCHVVFTKILCGVTVGRAGLHVAHVICFKVVTANANKGHWGRSLILSKMSSIEDRRENVSLQVHLYVGPLLLLGTHSSHSFRVIVLPLPEAAFP